MPQISVIVPVYKVEPYLHRCADSILKQSFSDFELILVDDGSPDGCPAICDSYASLDHRVHVIHQKNGGLSAARNAGIDWVFQHSDSRWLTFIDSDDFIHPRMLEALLSSAEALHTDISICGYAETASTLPECTIPAPGLWKTEDFYTAHTITATIACGKLYAKQCFQALRYPLGKLHEDEFLTYQLLFRTERIAFLDAPLYAYYTNESSITHAAWKPSRLDAFEALDEQLAFFQAHQLQNAYLRRVRSYLWSLNSQYHGILQERNKYPKEARWLRRKARRFLLEHSDAIEPAWPETQRVYAFARPCLYWLKRLLHRLP